MKIFIAGNSRSGTTMMSRILGNHESVFTFEELHFFDELLTVDNPDAPLIEENAIQLFATLCAVQRDGYFGPRNPDIYIEESKAVLKDFENISALELFEKFLTSESRLNNRIIPCEQTPQTIFSLDAVLGKYSDARVIIMVRDPREVLLSQKYKWKRRKFSGGKIPAKESLRAKINYHPVIISKIWNRVMRRADRYKNNPAVLFVKYEDLILSPEIFIKRVCNHVGIEFNSKMLDIPVAGSSNTEDTNLKRGIDSSRSGQWEKGGLNTTEIYICEQENEKLMAQYGYEQSKLSFSVLLLNWYKISLPFQLSLALLFNLKRLKNVKNIIRR